MTDPAKETVIIVHGTWAAPKPAKAQWYQPIGGGGAADGFVSKLNTALQERDSPARCWAHCSSGNPIFQWSGENDWIARTHAASALADYVAKLQNEGWYCHIVAHSHGGNVVVEALPQILAAQTSSGSPSKIVTLGTPFIDTRAPMQIKEQWATAFRRRLTRWSLGIFYIFFAVGLFGFARDILTTNSLNLPLASASLLSLILIVYQRRSTRIHRSHKKGAVGIQRSHEEGAAGIQLQFLAIGSVQDEAWQILHHMRNIDNPLAVRLNLKNYLVCSVHSRMARAADIEHIRGAEPFRSLSTARRWFWTLAHVAPCLLFIMFPMIMFPITWGWIFSGFGVLLLLLAQMGLLTLLDRNVPEGAFYSASQAPFRCLFRLTGALLGLPNEVLTYLVRRKAWPIIVAMAMGLEGYRFELPGIERQHPNPVPENFVKYEDMPKGAERNALDKRSAWVARHLKDISQTFSKLVVTEADISALLRIIEEDHTLVHAAYYTDDKCIARIADWIADRG